MMGAIKIGEMMRTAEILVDIAKKHEGFPERIVMEILHMIRSTNRTTEEDLKFLQDILDKKMKEKVEPLVPNVEKLFKNSSLKRNEFADYLFENRNEIFKDGEIFTITRVIQAFRARGDNSDEVFAEVEMEFVGDDEYKTNVFQDYMYDDGKFVETGVRVGVEKNGFLILDKGIHFADNARMEHAEPHKRHIDDPEHYDRNGRFISGSGEKCPSCGVEYEDSLAVAMCPCHDG